MTLRRMLMAAVWTVAARAGAQTVTGTIVDQTGRPVAGVLVQMLDSASNIAARALSTEGGTFRVATPRPGSYRLRTMRIGYRPTTSDPVTLVSGGQIERRITLTGVQIRLDTMRVVDRSSCRITNDSAATTFAVLEQARTALAAAQLTLAGRTISATTLSYDRTLDPEGRHVVRQVSRLRTDYVAQPWLAVSPDSLHRAGFVITDRDNVMAYYAPSIEVMLSSQFGEDHCFRLTADAKQPAVLGLAFEPTPQRRGTPEIRGTLWLDRISSELRRVDYYYTNVSAEQEHAGAGGMVDFARLRNGGWTISRWNIRMPVLEQVVQVLALGGTKKRVAEIQVAGGELSLATLFRAGVRDTLWSRPPLVLRGALVDSATGAPVRGDVSLSGTTLSARTDDRGRFAISGVLPGTYIVETQTPELAAINATNQTTLTFDDSTKTYDLRIPTVAQLASAVCQARPLGPGTGAIMGHVYQRGDTIPAAGVRVVAEWTVLTPQSGNTLVREGRRLEGKTASDGAYRLCGLPVNTSFTLTAITSSSIADPRGIYLSGRFARADLTLDRNRGGGATLTGMVLLDSTKSPISGAEVSLPELSKSTLSGANGAFRLADIPPGEQHVIVRRIGFGPLDTTVIFAADGTVDRQIFLARVHLLDSVVVTDRATETALRDFEENRKIGLGHFLDRAELAKKDFLRPSSVIAEWPGVGLAGLNGHAWVLGTRKGPPMCPPGVAPDCYRSHGFYVPEAWEAAQGVIVACYALVYLDNTLMNRGNPTTPFDLNSIRVDQIEALEWYAGASETPMRYSTLSSACGVLVIHTRRTP